MLAVFNGTTIREEKKVALQSEHGILFVTSTHAAPSTRRDSVNAQSEHSTVVKCCRTRQTFESSITTSRPLFLPLETSKVVGLFLWQDPLF